MFMYIISRFSSSKPISVRYEVNSSWDTAWDT